MNVNLTSQQEAMIREQVASGHYSDSNAVIREALRLLEERDRKLLGRLRAAIAI